MNKEEMLNKGQQALTPFETQNIVTYVKNLTLKGAMENPWIIGLFAILIFYAVVKRSKAVLAFLFAVVSISFLIRFTLPSGQGNELSLASTLPFAFGGLVIGGFLIYLLFIKSE